MNYYEYVMSLNPISYWRLGESTGATVAVDEMGVQDGEYSAGVSLGHAGPPEVNDGNTCAKFEYYKAVTIPDNIAHRNSTDITIDFWFNVYDLSKDTIFFNKWGEWSIEDDCYGLWYQGSTKEFVYGFSHANGAQLTGHTSSGLIEADKWYHCRFSYVQGEGLKIYLGKNLVFSAPSIEAGLIGPGITDLYIGKDAYGRWSYAYIDELFIIDVPVDEYTPWEGYWYEADFVGNPLTGLLPLSVEFTDLSIGESITSWLWDFGDGETSIEQNPTHIYASAGLYTVLLIINDIESEAEIKEDYIRVFAPDEANFIGSPLVGESPLTVQFTDLSTGESITSWLWDFGDGARSTLQNPIHIYTAPKYYTVSLMVNGDATETKENYIYVTMSNIIAPGSLKTSNKFITLGWVKDPIMDLNDYLVPLAIADYWGNVETSDKSIMFKLYKKGGDYRLGFNNSRSKLIKKTLKISLNDKKWHLLGWVCQNDDGNMKYFIDDYVLDAENGVDLDGLDYSIAYSTNTRHGGGDVWCPYIYKRSQSISIYNWRFGLGFTLDDDTIRKLNAEDRLNLNI